MKSESEGESLEVMSVGVVRVRDVFEFITHRKTTANNGNIGRRGCESHGCV